MACPPKRFSSAAFPSYVGRTLDELRVAPEWRRAFAGAGLSLATCDFAVLVGEVAIGLGQSEEDGPAALTAAPAILAGYDDTLALVFPEGHDVRVIKRWKGGARLVTTWGHVEICFGAPVLQDAWSFPEIRPETPEATRLCGALTEFLDGLSLPCPRPGSED